MSDLAREAQRRGGGFLSRIISAASEWSRPSRKYDWERDSWERFRPDAFYPLDSGARIERRLSLECEIYTAMPGAQEAFRFAQTLGVGRFVPCFLLFTDVGAPVVRLLPMGDDSPDQVFARLRSWIDSFYEVNHSTLTHWTQVEGEIEKICGELRSSVYKVDAWRRERSGRWGLLQRLSRYLVEMTQSPPSSGLLTKIRSDEIPWEMKTAVDATSSLIQRCEQRQTAAEAVANWIDSAILGRVAVGDTARELGTLREKYGPHLPGNIRSQLEETERLFAPVSRPDAPSMQLLSWWRSNFGRAPSRKEYDLHRSAWLPIVQAKYGDDAALIAKMLGEGTQIVRTAAFAQPLDRDPKQAAYEVVSALGSYFGVPPNDPSWSGAVSEYARALTSMFGGWRSHAPPWLLPLGITASPPLCWGDCIPDPSELHGMRKTETLESLPTLRTLLEKLTAHWDAVEEWWRGEWREQHSRALADLRESVGAWQTTVALLDADKRSAWLALITRLSALREEIQGQVLADARSLGPAAYPGGTVRREEVTRLMGLLDSYDRAVSSLHFPFEGDPAVLRVALDESPVKAARIRDVGETNPSRLARSELTKMITEAEASAARWPTVKQEALAWSPAGSLFSSLGSIVPGERMQELLTAAGADGLEGAVTRLSGREEIARFLDNLTAQELLALDRRLSDGKSPRFASHATMTKQALFEAVLVGIGLPFAFEAGLTEGMDLTSPEKIEGLSDKVERGAFDVFLAHHSEDKPLILRLGQLLRARGIYPWIDVEQVPPGRWFQDVIQSAVRTVNAAAIAIGPSGIGKWQAMEIRAFVSRCVETNIPLIPVLLPGCRGIPEDLPFLREANYVQFTDDIAEPEGLSRLVWGITGQKAS